MRESTKNKEIDVNDRSERRAYRFGGMILITVVIIAGIVAAVAYQRYQTSAKIAVQREAEKNRIIQEEKTKRTETRSQTLKDIVPWSK